MSIKRVKQAKRGPRRNDEAESSVLTKKPPEKQWVWADDVATQSEEAFLPYALTATFEKGALLLHSKFGKGVVTDIDGPNIEVLFAEGAKKLRHTPAPVPNLLGGPPVR